MKECQTQIERGRGNFAPRRKDRKGLPHVFVGIVFGIDAPILTLAPCPSVLAFTRFRVRSGQTPHTIIETGWYGGSSWGVYREDQVEPDDRSVNHPRGTAVP